MAKVSSGKQTLNKDGESTAPSGPTTPEEADEQAGQDGR